MQAVMRSIPDIMPELIEILLQYIGKLLMLLSFLRYLESWKGTLQEHTKGKKMARQELFNI